MTMTIQSVPVDAIHIDEDTDFRTQGTDVSELAASIKAFGLIQPITIAPNGTDGTFVVVAGRRRLRAYLELGLADIDAIVRDDMDDQAQVIGQIIENLQREDVSILDEARAFAQLGDYGMKQKDVASACGVSPAHVSGRLALLKLDPKTLAKVEEGKYPLATAVKLARLPKGVRDSLDSATPSEWEISSAERRHEDNKAIESLMKQVAEATGLPTGGKLDGVGYQTSDQMAEQIGLTDEDKPKSHSWDIGGRIHRSDHDSDESFLAAIGDAKPKGVYVHTAGAHATVVLVDSANLDKARKEEQERQREEAERRQEEAAKQQADFDDSLAPLIDTPDKAGVLAFLIEEAIGEAIRGYNHLPRLMLAAQRLDIQVEDGADEDRVEEILLSFASRNTTDAIRTLLALQNHVDNLLVSLGFLDTYPMEHVSVYAQLTFLKEGKISRDQLTADAEERLAAEEAAEAEQNQFDDAFEAEVERRLADLLQSEETDTEGITDEELDAITAEIRDQVEAQFESGDTDLDLGGEEG